MTKSKIGQNLDFGIDGSTWHGRIGPNVARWILKTLEKSIAEENQGRYWRPSISRAGWNKERRARAGRQGDGEWKEPYIYYITLCKPYRLSCFAKTVNYQMETSELYKMNGHYLTILVDVEKCILVNIQPDNGSYAWICWRQWYQSFGFYKYGQMHNSITMQFLIKIRS